MNNSTNIFAPQKRIFAPAPNIKSFDAKESLLSPDFLLCFFSFAMWMLIFVWGTLFIIGFFLPWGLIVIRNKKKATEALKKNWPLFLLGIWTLLSFFWSDDSMSSLKGAIEFIATIAIGILAGSCVRPRALMAALFYAYILGGLLSLAYGGTEIISFTGEVAFSGIFGSKNAFSANMSLLMLTALAVLIDKKQPFILRFSAAIAAFGFAPYMLYHGRSLDSVAPVFLAPATLLFVVYLRRYHSTVRKILFFSFLIIMITVILILSVTETNPLSFLTLVGKDATLTGRTWLWSRAMALVSQRPILGVGFQAFWKLWNPHAQELWYGMHVPPGANMGFHNEYVYLLVELGLGGLLFSIYYFFTAAKRISKKMFEPMTSQQNFAFLLFTFIIVRTPIEVQVFAPFAIGMIMLCLIWIYFEPPPLPKKQPLGLPGKNLQAQP